MAPAKTSKAPKRATTGAPETLPLVRLEFIGKYRLKVRLKLRAVMTCSTMPKPGVLSPKMGKCPS